MSSFSDIETFWKSHKRLAYFGLSRKKGFPNKAYQMLAEEGYDLVAVHPDAPEIDGVPTRAALDGVDPLPEAAAIVAGKQTTLDVLKTCAEHGLRSVFVQSDGWSKSAEKFCAANDIAAVSGCVYLHHGKRFPHNLHRWVVRTFLS